MKQSNTLTGIVLSESFKVRQIYGIRCKKKVSQGEYLRGLLASYEGALGDDYAQRVITGKQTIPKSIAEHYRDDVHPCPQGLYADIESYYQSSSITYRQRMVLKDNLTAILQTIPEVDREEIWADVESCSSAVNGVYILLTWLIYYAWRTDLAGIYISSSISGGNPPTI